MSKATKILMIDTETAGTLDNAFCYDIGCGIATLHSDRISNPLNYINYNVYFEKRDLMRTAYYAEKLPSYYDEIFAGEREVLDMVDIRRRIHRLMKEEGIKVVCAHNAAFDISALNNTIRDATDGKTRYFLPYGTEVWDTLKMARQVLGNMPTYYKFCEANNFMTNHQVPQPRMTAEVIYRYITKNLNFVEAHTGLRDVEIETEILHYLVRQKKKMNKVLYPAH